MKPTQSDWSADARVRECDGYLSPCRRLPADPRRVTVAKRARTAVALGRRLEAAGTGYLAASRLWTWASALLCAWLMGGLAAAATIGSANASLTAGGRQSVGTVVVDASIGGIGGSASVGTVVARHGVTGQLTDLQSVAVSASPATLNEATTRQLVASAVFTDTTMLPLAATAVTWSVSGDGMASVSATGLATAATVYQNTNGFARADYLGQFGTLTLSVLNVNTDNFSTYAGDTIDDAWQVTHFGIGSASAAAAADPDGDGQNNLFEYLAGTTPTSSTSAFNVGINAASLLPRAVNFSPVVAGRTYTVEFTTNLATRIFYALPFGSTSDTNGIRYVTDGSPTNATRYYRIRIALP